MCLGLTIWTMTVEEYHCGRTKHWYISRESDGSDEKLLKNAEYVQRECEPAGGCKNIENCQIRDLIKELQTKKA